ncbi:MAG: DUF1361 domain-containing protein [Spirochaetales bacterium]|nr:DUF1361 domain-containing protein [Spirochaetales bacterium]
MKSTRSRLQKSRILLFPACLAGFSAFLTCIRCLYTGTGAFLFLNWNLFLAALPAGFAWLLSLPRRPFRNRIMQAVLLLLWFCFFPNSLYILTDFIHLGRYSYAPVWFDFILILSFSLCGLLFAFLSIQMIERHYSVRISPRKLRLLITLLFYISAFGIYLGRFLRWNSWDLFTRPHLVMADIMPMIFRPLENIRVWTFVFLSGTMFSLAWFACISFSHSLVDIQNTCSDNKTGLQSENAIPEIIRNRP